MAKVLEYRSMLSGWQTIRELPIEATDEDWISVGKRNYTEVRVRVVRKETQV